MACRARFFYAYLFLVSLFLQGCATPTLNVELNASDDINPDNHGDSYAVLVRFYQLTDPSLFEKASAGALLRKDDELLSATLLEKRELMVAPGLKSLLEIPKANASKYLAVVAFFRDAQGQTQMSVKKINAGKIPFSTQLELQITGKQIALSYQ